MARKGYYRNLRQLSGYHYVPSELKIDHDRYQLVIVRPDKCDHQRTVCPTLKCVRDWMLDYKLWFPRTAGGRKLAAAVGIDPDIRQTDTIAA